MAGLQRDRGQVVEPKEKKQKVPPKTSMQEEDIQKKAGGTPGKTQEKKNPKKSNNFTVPNHNPSFQVFRKKGEPFQRFSRIPAGREADQTALSSVPGPLSQTWGKKKQGGGPHTAKKFSSTYDLKKMKRYLRQLGVRSNPDDKPTGGKKKGLANLFTDQKKRNRPSSSQPSPPSKNDRCEENCKENQRQAFDNAWKVVEAGRESSNREFAKGNGTRILCGD